MDYLAIAGWASATGLGIMLAIYGIRNGGLVADAKEADQARKVAELALQVTSRDFDSYRVRAEEIEEELSEELDRYENQEISAIRDEPDPVARVRRRRRLVGRVLSEAFTPTSDDSGAGVPEKAPT